ncbi:hypothetical protein LCM23_06345 [Cytobacillus kochii]|uniref:hypothetical protein n=1 Tax=Cytobacillus kochii TaxID=859143 RepID=UPI001CD6D7F5|nr:hypothetical protein [Cytobacillus kochii]MCA1025705.1 hypothetical protein [Cytobacillus kochii]
MLTKNQFSQMQSNIYNSMASQGMTFNPSVDCRNDLINHYGYSRLAVSNMSDGEVFQLMDEIEAAEKGIPNDETSLPIHLESERCDCGGKLKVSFVDCETRGDCEIYHCKCKVCNKEISFNYAEEWYEYDEQDAFGDLLNDLDNACFRGHFDRAKEVYQDANTFIKKGNNKSNLKEMLSKKLNYLSKYNIDFE